MVDLPPLSLAGDDDIVDEEEEAAAFASHEMYIQIHRMYKLNINFILIFDRFDSL